MTSRNPHLSWGLQLLSVATRSVCKCTWGQLMYARGQDLSGDHGDKNDMHDLFGSPHMMWGLQDCCVAPNSSCNPQSMLLGMTWSGPAKPFGTTTFVQFDTVLDR